MRTVAVTHRVYAENVKPLTEEELRRLIDERLIAVGTNWRGRPDGSWAGNEKASDEFDLFDSLASNGGLVIANYDGLGSHQRIVGRVVPTATRRPEIWNELRVLRLLFANRIDSRTEGVEDLQVTPGRTIIDVTGRAGDRVLRALGKSLI